jgi:hypothetical protein
MPFLRGEPQSKSRKNLAKAAIFEKYWKPTMPEQFPAEMEQVPLLERNSILF